MYISPKKLPKQTIDITLPADLKFSSLVRRLSEEVFSYVGFTREWTDRLKLVVDELFMNSNRYGSKKSDGKIYVIFSFDENEVTFRIEDEGGGETKINAEELNKIISKNSSESGDLSKTSGRGLALISSLWTDSLLVEDSSHGGIAISFSKKISSETPPAPPPLVPVSAQAQASEASPVAPKAATETMQLSGEIDASNLQEKVKPVDEKISTLAEGSVLAIDCKGLSYINSTVIGHFAAWHNALQKRKGQLVLKNVNDQIREVLKLVGLSKVLYVES